MTSDLPTPDVIGPELVATLDYTIGRAERAEGKAALGPIVEEICSHYRALAICIFAEDGDVNEFFHWLLHSPLARRHYLRSVYAVGAGEPRDGRASLVDPVLDAMAARQWKLAAEINVLQSPMWVPGEEYEDDFCYADFLRRISSGADVDEVLEKWTASLDGGSDPRREVAQALKDKDPVAFEDALRALVQSNAAKARKMADVESPSVLAEVPTFEPNRWISVEGLALIALAERLGLSVDYEVESCPAALRTDSYAPFRPRGYPNQSLA
jgi:hypothetical protein